MKSIQNKSGCFSAKESKMLTRRGIDLTKLDFDGKNLIRKQEHFHIEKEFKREMRVDKPEEKSMLGKVVTVPVDRPLR